MFLRSTRTAVGGIQLARGQLVAHEKLGGDVVHFLRGQQHGAAPPFLEFEIAGGFGIDLGIKIVRLLPIGVGRMLRLEIRHEMRAVEYAAADISRERGEPRSTEQPA